MLDSILPLLSDPAAWAALVTLVVMEVVLGIDNLIFISILSNKLPEHQRQKVRRIGIGLALVMRLALLSIIAWLVGLVQPVFTVAGNEFSWKDLILIAGGLFLVWKATKEIHHTVDPTPTHDVMDKKDVMITNAGAAIFQIILLDLVFSIDSILTAVGMTEHLPIMVVAVLVAVTVMLLAADPLANFINDNPSVVMLALGFLLMIGMVLIADGFGYHVPKGYIYAAMAFSAGVEALNMLGRRSASKKEKAEAARAEAERAEARARKAEAEAAAEGALTMPRPPLRFAGLIVGLLLAAGATLPAQAEVPTQAYQVVRAYPHDRTAFTEGLFFHEGALYESTGLYPSSVRQVRLQDGEILRRRDLPTVYFGEGLAALNGKLYNLTWRNHIGFIFKLEDFSPLGGFSYPGEGWGLTTDGRRLIMSDGTDQIRFLDPDTLAETGRISVTADGRPLDQINELEWIDGEVFANLWQDNRIARIDPETGVVKAFIDLTDLVPKDAGLDPNDDVLNGIAWDAAGKRLFVTGKRWPQLYEIRLR